jgi:predicted Zn-dependent protease
VADYDPAQNLLRGELLLELQRFDDLAAVLEALGTEGAGKDARFARLEGHYALHRKDWAKVARSFVTVNASQLANANTRLQESTAYFHLGDVRNLSLSLRNGLAHFPDDLPLLELAAVFAEREGDWESASQAWGKALSVDATSRRIAIKYGLACFEAGKPHHSMKMLERGDLSDITDAESAVLHTYAALVRGNNEQLDDALAKCDEYIDPLAHKHFYEALRSRLKTHGIGDLRGRFPPRVEQH